MTALMIKAINVPRMTRVTWYKHRASVLGIPGLFLLAAVTGLFAGVPWVAREFEGGGFRFTWTQSVSPLGWLLGTFGPLTLLAEVTAAICGVAAHWWFQVAQFRLNGGTTPWGWESLEMTPLSIVSWTLLAMALALLLGVTIRRMLPAMIAFAITFGGCLVLAQTWLPGSLFRVGAIPLRVNYSTQEYPAGSYVAQTWFARPGGPKLNPMTVYAQMNSAPQPLNQARWLAQHHLTEWIAYQPHSHLVWLALARNGIIVAVAALAVLASIWLFRKYPAE